MRFITVFAALAAAVAAYTPPITPDYSKTPSGNAIATPGLHQIVPQDAPFEIKWNPTTPGTVTLILLRGPSTNVIPIATIANAIPNSGSYSWTPSGLAADTTGYGILLVVDSDKSYQYSTQFGMGPGAVVSSASSTSSTSTSSMSSTSSTSSEPSASSPAPVVPATTFVKAVVTTTFCPSTVTSTSVSVSVPVEPVTMASVATTSVSMTSASTTSVSMTSGSVSTAFSGSATPTVPASKSSSALSPLSTGAADRNMVSFGGLAIMAGVAAVLAF